MKQLLTILLIFFTVIGKAQTVDTVHIKLAKVDLSTYLLKTDTTNKWVNTIANNATLDSLIYYIGSTRYAIPVPKDTTNQQSPLYYNSSTKTQYLGYNSGSTVINGISNDPTKAGDSTKISTDYLTKMGKVGVVTSISALQSFNSVDTLMIVTDTLQGGLFAWSAAGTVDNGVVFSATGKGSGYWVRQYDKSKGVVVDWWGNDSYAINKALSYAGVNGIVNFTSGRTYPQYDALVAQDGQIINGNGATIKRSPEAANITTLSKRALTTDSIITVTSVPALWKVGDWLQIYQDSTDASAIQFRRQILAINGNNISLHAQLGTNNYQHDTTGGHPQLTYWDSVITKVRKVYYQLTTPFVTPSSYNVVPTDFILRDLIFDGNKYQNNGNFSWYVNSAIYARGYQAGILISNCTFLNMPNDCIEGHGMRVINNRAFSLNSSFMHLTASNTTGMKSQIPSLILGNFVDSSNQRSNYPNNGHSEGVVTNSYSSGYVSIQNNRFYHGGECTFGSLTDSYDTLDLAAREMFISGNYFKGFKAIAKTYNWITTPDGGLPKFGHIYIDGNVYDSCGQNDWTTLRNGLNTGVDTLVIGQNLLLGGTTWKLPTLNYSGLFRYILNNQDTAAQHAIIYIDSTIGSKKYINSDNTKILTSDTKGNINVSAFNPYSLNNTRLNFNSDNGLYNNLSIGEQGSYGSYGLQINSSAPGIKLTVSRTGGGYAAALSQGWGKNITSGKSTLLSEIGTFGTLGTIDTSGTPTITYLYFGAGSDASYSNNNLQLYPNKTTALTTVNDAVGDFVTRNSSSGLITKRTASEVLTDIGAAPLTKFTTGTATLSAGTVTISSTAVTSSSKIFITRNTTGGTLGFLSAPTASIVAGTSFVINSSSNTDTSTVNWMIVN